MRGVKLVLGWFLIVLFLAATTAGLWLPPVISHAVNTGSSYGTVNGYFLYAAYFDYDVVCQFDGDGQHIAAELPKIIQPIVEGKADFGGFAEGEWSAKRTGSASTAAAAAAPAAAAAAPAAASAGSAMGGVGGKWDVTLKTPAGDMLHLSGDEVKALLAEPDPATRRGLRDMVLLSTLYDTAARVQEICDLNTCDVRAARPMVVTLRGKGSKTRRVPPMAPTAQLVKDYLTGRQDEKLAELQPGDSAIVDAEGETFAAWRAPDGELFAVSNVCPHLGCKVHWNSVETSWDCPCHGSRFRPDGTVIEGPALSPLKPKHPPIA